MELANEREELVSVVVPAFNAERTISETLDSALAQTYRNLEVLVVDDGSRDKTADVVQAYTRRDGRVHLLRKANGGLSSARNHGIAHGRGPLIALLDADDLWHPEKIEKQVAALRRTGGRAALVYTWTALLDAGGRFTGRHLAARHEGDVYANLLLYNFLAPGSAALIRRDALDAVGGFDENLRGGCEDLMCCLLLAERYDFAVVPELLTGCREIESGMSHATDAMRRAYDHVMTFSRRRHPELPGRLFRWSEGKFSVRQAHKCLRLRRPLAAAAVLGRALWADPAFVLTLVLGRKLPELVTPARPSWRGQPFLPPRADLRDFRPPRGTRLEERRHAYLATIRTRRPAEGGSIHLRE